MARLNRKPRGFTGILDIQNEGQTPPDVSEVLQPAIDLQAYYSAEKGLQAQQVVSAVGALGGGAEVTIPSKESWLIYAVGGGITLAGNGDDVALSIRIKNVPIVGGGLSETIVANWSTAARNMTAGGFIPIGWTPGFPLILNGGQALRVQVDDIEGPFSTETMRIEVLYVQVSSFPGATVPTA